MDKATPEIIDKYIETLNRVAARARARWQRRQWIRRRVRDVLVLVALGAVAWCSLTMR